MTELEAKLSAFDYEDLGSGRYAIRGLKDTLAEHADIPEGVVEIKGSAFNGCSLLRSVSLPDTLLSIRHHAFRGCSSLEEIHLPDSIKVIEDHAFDSCSALKKVVLPKGLTEISWALFNNASSLKEVIIPDSIKKICKFAFVGTAIKEIHVSTSVQMIEEYAFSGSIKKVYYAGSRQQWKEAFKGKTYSNQFSLSCAVQTKKPAATQEKKTTMSAAAIRAKEEELEIHIKACEAAICEQGRVLERIQEKNRTEGLKPIPIFLFIFLPLALGIILRLISQDYDLFGVLGILCLLGGGVMGALFILTAFLGRDFNKKRKEKAQAELQDALDIFECLCEMLRLAQTEGKVYNPKEEYGTIRLSYYSEKEKRCETCAYFGETVVQSVGKDTGHVYSQKHVKYICRKHSDLEVFEHNCCNDHCFVQVAKALPKAIKLYEAAKEHVKAGFR